MKALKTIAKALLTITLLGCCVLAISEAETASLQVVTTTSAILGACLSYKGLDKLGTFKDIR